MTQVVTHESWFGRIGSSIKGMLLGAVLFVVAFPVLFLNEGRAVKTDKALKEGARAVVEANPDAVDPANDGQFVHLSGLAETDSVLEDDLFGVSVNAIRFERRVEMLQWREKKEQKTRKKVGGGTETVTTYTYVKEWSPEFIPSSRFQESASHQNPTDMPFAQLTKETSDVSVGAFRLPKSLVQKITTTAVLDVKLEDVQKEWAEGLKPYTDATTGLNGFYWSRSGGAAQQVGDVRILFAVTLPTDVSIMAQQTRNTFAPFIAKNGHELNLLTVGVESADQMFATAAVQNSRLTWILRVVGGVLMFAGISLVLQPLSVLADVIPPVGSLVEMGTGLVALAVAGALSLATISLAWLFYRPLIGVPLLLVGVGLVAFVVLRLVKQPLAATPQPFVGRPFNSEQQQEPSNENSIGV